MPGGDAATAIYEQDRAPTCASRVVIDTTRRTAARASRATFVPRRAAAPRAEPARSVSTGGSPLHEAPHHAWRAWAPPRPAGPARAERNVEWEPDPQTGST